MKKELKEKKVNKQHKAMQRLGITPPKDYAENKKRLDESRDFPVKEKHDD